MIVFNFRSSGSSRLLVDSEKEKSLLLLKLFPLALSRRLSLQLSSIMGALPFPQRGESCSLNHRTAFRLKAYNLPVQDLNNLQDQRIEKTGKQSPLWKIRYMQIYANLRAGTGCLQRPHARMNNNTVKHVRPIQASGSFPMWHLQAWVLHLPEEEFVSCASSFLLSVQQSMRKMPRNKCTSHHVSRCEVIAVDLAMQKWHTFGCLLFHMSSCKGNRMCIAYSGIQA